MKLTRKDKKKILAGERSIDEFCIMCTHASVTNVLDGEVYCDVLQKTIGAWCIRCDEFRKVRK